MKGDALKRYALKNTTDFSDQFLRRMIRWLVKSLGYDPRLRQAKFRNRTRGAYSGRAYLSGRIVVSIGPTSSYPTTASGYKAAHRDQTTGEYESFNDRLEGLVGVTAHELCHVNDYRHRGNSSEYTSCSAERRALRLFREHRDRLLAEWTAVLPLVVPEPVVEPTIRSFEKLIQRRAEKAQRFLDQWQRKLKLAQTKLRKYRKQVAYYEKKAAARPPKSA